MSSNYILTIAIPSYNRNVILNKNLVKLLPQLNNSCELLIIDNHSDFPISESAKEIIVAYKNLNIRIFRNVANVGGNENIVRCLEYAQGQYVWILGDDDIPCENALENVLKEVASNPDAILINMYAEAPSHQNRNSTKVYKGAIGYLRSSKFLGELIFISSLVFKRLPSLRFLYSAHLMQFTFAPQLFVALLALGKDGICVLSDKKIITSGGEFTPLTQQYPSVYVAVGLGGLLDYSWSNEIHKALSDHLINVRKVWMTPYGIVNQLLQISISSDIENSKETALRLYRTIGSRLYSIGSPINMERLLFSIGILVIFFPKIGFAVKKYLWRVKKKNIPYNNEISISRDRL